MVDDRCVGLGARGTGHQGVGWLPGPAPRPGRSSAARDVGRVRHHQVERGAQVRGQGLEPPPLDQSDPSRRPASSCQVGPGDLERPAARRWPTPRTPSSSLTSARWRWRRNRYRDRQLGSGTRRRELVERVLHHDFGLGRGISARASSIGSSVRNPSLPRAYWSGSPARPPLDHGVDGVDCARCRRQVGVCLPTGRGSTPKPPRRCAAPPGSVRPDVRWSRRRGPARTRPATPRQDVAASWSWRARSSCMSASVTSSSSPARIVSSL